MSADNYARCPKCSFVSSKKRRSIDEELTKAYGKISEKEYIELRNQLLPQFDDGFRDDQETSLREDYRIEMDVNGEFSVSYLARCSKCDFSFEYEHTQSVVT
jgi:DNA-directed RNA polymerase subunit RPC12/RpoP